MQETSADRSAHGNLVIGEANPHVVGIVMKEMVRRAIGVIREQRFIFEHQAKEGYGGKPDLVTSADRAAQQVYVRTIRECFPSWGIVAEEENLRIESRQAGIDVYFTVDPLDGTKAFARRQSHGIGTMISLVGGGTVVAAYVGDVMTQEIYGFRPGSPNVHRISEFEHAERLSIVETRPLSEQIVLLRTAPQNHVPIMQRVAGRQGLFRDIEVGSGSIGTSMARLWKGEVGGVVLDSDYSTPWDVCPILGISKQLGFAFLKPSPDTTTLLPYEFPVSKNVERTGGDVLVVHQSRTGELAEWLARR
jgi:fructose-1,6-bisphosphatase/inositol monophosphatase family enzyme